MYDMLLYTVPTSNVAIETTKRRPSQLNLLGAALLGACRTSPPLYNRVNLCKPTIVDARLWSGRWSARHTESGGSVRAMPTPSPT
ncbi:hypothetical protein E2C01_089443 [Portunus trituberculatus]|uniref:Uncharacterized protein n=1 Tax=Portunus trituberculatus TaxID=210409 RepID=A0A5B7J8T2_PORTR|nr:hypothetical protein [Portunus trituberculatus]